MTILWSPEAIDDLMSLRAYIADENPAAARGVDQSAVEVVDPDTGEITPR